MEDVSCAGIAQTNLILQARNMEDMYGSCVVVKIWYSDICLLDESEPKDTAAEPKVSMLSVSRSRSP